MKALKPKRLRHYLRTMGKALFILVCLFSLASATAAQNSYRLSKAPFYKSFKKVDLNQQTGIAHLAVRIDEKTRTEFFYKGREKALEPLITAMNQYLDSLRWTSNITTARFSAASKGAPYLFVGSSESEIAPPGAEMLREEFDKFPPMVMYVKKPSGEWKALLADQLEQSQAEYALIFWIGFNEYPKANKGIFKKKVVLGTGYEPEIRFLSDELEPVEVLQLSGMIINKNGDIIRAGSEAFLFEDTPFWAQALEVSKSIDDNKMEHSINQMRREDLSGRPLAWKMAVHHLLNHLAQRPTELLAERQ